MKNLKWSVEVTNKLMQQQMYLKKLKEQKKVQSWKVIAEELSIEFPNSAKSSKQCRQKYVNYTRFANNDNGNKWIPADDKKLFILYNQYGSTWNSFTEKLGNKSENCIKNRFYNRLKKFSKKLDQHRKFHKENLRGATTFQSFLRILDFSNQAQTLSLNENKVIDKEGLLFKTRHDILNFTLNQQENCEISCQDMCNIIKKIKQINVKIRCFGIYKAKNRKNWKLSTKGFEATLQLDKKTAKLTRNPQSIQNIEIAQEENPQTKLEYIPCQPICYPYFLMNAYSNQLYPSYPPYAQYTHYSSFVPYQIENPNPNAEKQSQIRNPFPKSEGNNIQ